MKLSRLRSFSVNKLAVLGLAVVVSVAPALPQQAAPAAVSGVVLTLDPAQSNVHWMVDSTLHTVHGTFALKSGTVHFDPKTGKAGGEIVVSAASGDSGSTARDKRMHKEILETTRFPEAVFRPTQIEGPVAASGGSDVKLSGVISIHGADHALSAQVHTEFSGGNWKGTATFDVPYVQWGIKDPSNFLLKVKPVVRVEVEMSGGIETAK